MILFAMGVILRLMGFTSLSSWPVLEEARNGFFALEWSQLRPMPFICELQQQSPFFIGIQAVLFRWLGSSVASLWASSTFWSIAGMGLGLLAVRRFLNPSAAFLAGGFIAFGFWPNWSGRYFNGASLTLFWEWGCLWLLGRLLFSEKKEIPLSRAWILGLWTGLGFLTQNSWGWLALGVIAALMGKFRGNAKGKRILQSFGWALALSFLPFLQILIREDVGRFFLRFSGSESTFTIKGWVEALGFYLSLPWMRSSTLNVYGPSWGGLLNPLVGSLLVIGTAWAWKKRASIEMRWLLGATAFLMIPGFITTTQDAFQIVLAWPFLTLLAALGADAVMRPFLSEKRWIAAAWVLIVLGGAMDGYHLFDRYHDLWGRPSLTTFAVKNGELAEADRCFKEMTAHEGRGKLLLNFRADVSDPSLILAAGSYAVGSWALADHREVRWTGLLINRHYVPFLSTRFPRAQFRDLGDLGTWPAGQMMVGLFPPGAIDEPSLKRWIKADEVLQPLTSFLVHNQGVRSESKIMRWMNSLYPFFKGDPFLESCFYEKTYLYASGIRDAVAAEAALQDGLTKGYPAAHFYYQLGQIHRAAGRKEEARRAFEQAVAAPGNRTDAARYLEKP